METIEDSIRNGLVSWRNNLEIGVPYLLSNIITAVLLVLSILGVAVSTGTVSALSVGMGQSSAIVTLAVFCATGLAASAAIAALNAYFSAGAIGMSLEMVRRGKTTLSDMADYGRARWPDIFKANMLWIALLGLPGIVVTLPSVYAFYIRAFLPGISFAIVAAWIYATYAALMCLMYTITCTAIIADGSGLAEGVASAKTFAMKNKAKVLITVFAYMGAMYAATLAWSVLTAPLGLLQFLFPGIFNIVQGLLMLAFLFIASFTITPLYTIWLTRVYISKGSKDAKTGHLPASPRQTRGRRGTERDIYV